jgi:IS30 family transposase
LRQLGRDLGRPASTIVREIRRNGGPARYRATQAERRALCQARRPKRCLLAQRAALRVLVAQKLALQWSPQQISGWLVARFPHDQSMRVSHETIYRSLFVQARGVLKKQLLEHLRSGRRMRHPRTQRRSGHDRQPTTPLLSIRERPAEAQDRAVPGHWEGDLLAGTTHSHIATLVERHSRFVILVKLPARDSTTVVQALSRQIRKLPAHLRRSLTWDRGAELAEHQSFKVATDVTVYFCDPYSPWQRGTNENTNGLLRQYFPRGQSLAPWTQVQLNAIARRLNQRPRATLGFRTPANILYQTVASTG